ncbi:hypothetical protein GCM10023238_26330 [Streptomyces heliomycini]
MGRADLVTVFGWRFMLADAGIINTALDSLGLPTPQWLEDTFWQRVAAITVNTWCGVPFMMISLLGGLQSIDASLYEAAEMDGANAWQRFRHVTLPACARSAPPWSCSASSGPSTSSPSSSCCSATPPRRRRSS